jgi:hypothetical protein
MSASDVYERDPHAAPDDAFETGTLEHLVPGNRGRLLDSRRTPVVVTDVLPSTGTFEVEVAAFEDVGARWEIEVERVGGFQFEPGQASADVGTVAALDEAGRRFDRPLSIPCAETERADTAARIEAARTKARGFLPGPSPFVALEAFLEGRGLSTMEEAFAERFVSNASSGELVKGHAIVLAQLGLCPYEGKVVRSPDLFAGEWSEDRRADHIVSRLGFVRELHAVDGLERVTLYRGLASDEPLKAPRARSFVSATFDPSVAEAHFSGGPSTVAAAIYRQVVPVERLFMTYRETRAMNRQFRESEVVLIGDPESPLF